MSIGDLTTWKFSSSGVPNVEDLDKATALRLKQWRIERGFTIPYCAGWDEVDRVVYVDERVPDTWEIDGKILQVVEGSLFWHESLEADLCRDYPDEHYQGAHTIASDFEDAYVRAHGFYSNRYEDEFWAPIIKACAARKSFPRVPKGMSLLPYHDSGDEALISRMTFV